MQWSLPAMKAAEGEKNVRRKKKKKKRNKAEESDSSVLGYSSRIKAQKRLPSISHAELKRYASCWDRVVAKTNTAAA